jgi:hypothetical protein
MGVSLAQSIVVSFTGALAFSLYFTTLIVCLRWLLFVNEGWQFKKGIKWGIVLTTLFIFVCNVVYLSMGLHETLLQAQHAIDNLPVASFELPAWMSIVTVSQSRTVKP